VSETEDISPQHPGYVLFLNPLLFHVRCQSAQVCVVQHAGRFHCFISWHPGEGSPRILLPKGSRYRTATLLCTALQSLKMSAHQEHRPWAEADCPAQILTASSKQVNQDLSVPQFLYVWNAIITWLTLWVYREVWMNSHM
jgi:hypothetical protein